MKFDKEKAVKVESTIDWWTPENDGDEITGVLHSKFNGNFGACYVINTGDKLVGTPSHSMLQSQLAEVPIGNMVNVKRVGSKEPTKKGHHPTILYEVLHYADI